jgi:hypothetical protein
MGHAVNKILKDMIVKSRQLKGLDAAYIPGWDCHGLPIENAIEKKFGRNLPRDEMQAKSRAFATEQIDLQMADFKRLGVLGDWDHPYRTMDFVSNEADEIRAFKRVVERGFVYRGLKPVYWCFDCGSSLAEFEIEYADKKSQTLDVGFKAPMTREGASRPTSGGSRRGRTSSRDLDHHRLDHPGQPGAEPEPELEYALVDTRAAADPGRSRWSRRPGPLQARRQGARHHRRARSSAAWNSAIRCTTSTPATGACRRCTWPTTPPPKTAPASSTPRPPTAWTTSTAASRTA